MDWAAIHLRPELQIANTLDHPVAHKEQHVETNLVDVAETLMYNKINPRRYDTVLKTNQRMGIWRDQRG
jgi:hypothetical protein